MTMVHDKLNIWTFSLSQFIINLSRITHRSDTTLQARPYGYWVRFCPDSLG